MKRMLMIAALVIPCTLWGDEITFTFLNFSTATFSASATGLSFGNAVNVLVTDNSNGSNFTLAAIDSGNTGIASSFVPGPPLIATFDASGPGSVLVRSGSHTFLSGTMEDDGKLEAQYPNRAGAFGSRFTVNFLDPAILSDLGIHANVAPEGSVSLTLAETQFAGGTLTGLLGGGSITIETTAPTPDIPTAPLFVSGLLLTGLYRKLTTNQPQQ